MKRSLATGLVLPVDLAPRIENKVTSPLTSHTPLATTHPMAPSRSPLTLVMSPFSTAAWSGNLCDLSCLGSGAIATGLSELSCLGWQVARTGCTDWTVLHHTPDYRGWLALTSHFPMYFTNTFVKEK